MSTPEHLFSVSEPDADRRPIHPGSGQKLSSRRQEAAKADAIDRARADREARKEGPRQPMSDAAFEAMAARLERGE